MGNRIQPVVLDQKFNIAGFIVFLGALTGSILKWKDFSEFFYKGSSLLNWHFFALCIFCSVFAIWFVLNNLWKQEYDAHDLTKKDRDNLMEELRISENERLTDVITGVPNSRSLEKDIEEYFLAKKSSKLQFILIDLKNFRQINKKYGYSKTNNLLRLIAQTIYRRMRRNEDMYKYFNDKNKRVSYQESFYRVYPGVDEFAFIIEGDQADALGFTNRLVDQFKFLSEKTADILGERAKLSFYCAIVEVDNRDSYEDVYKKAEDCYQIAKEGTADFNLCWHPINVETLLSNNNHFKKEIYKRSRELFEVLTLKEIN